MFLTCVCVRTRVDFCFFAVLAANFPQLVVVFCSLMFFFSCAPKLHGAELLRDQPHGLSCDRGLHTNMVMGQCENNIAQCPRLVWMVYVLVPRGVWCCLMCRASRSVCSNPPLKTSPLSYVRTFPSMVSPACWRVHSPGTSPYRPRGCSTRSSLPPAIMLAPAVPKNGRRAIRGGCRAKTGRGSRAWLGQ